MHDCPPDRVNIKFVNSVPVHFIEALYKEAGWWDDSWGRNPEFLSRIVKDSAVFAGAFCGEKLVGMGRALSDLASDAYIQDVVVLKEYRKKGIGKEIVLALVRALKEKGVDWIGLVAEPGTASFYRDMGFEVLDTHVPMKYRGK